MFMIAIIRWIAMVSYSDSFLIDDSCLAPTPCSCSGSWSSDISIDCNDKHLNATPNFLKTDDKNVLTLYIDLQNNALSALQNYAFKNLSSVNAMSIDIKLYNNHISYIGRHAFNGIDTISTILSSIVNEQNNNLTSIPVAIYNHHALKKLYIQSNPINSLGVATQSEMGNTLETLYIDLKEFTTWPNELGFLRVLKTLKLYNVYVKHIPSEAFQGFENTLTVLQINYVPFLDKIPNAVCQLLNLQDLTLNYFGKLNENTSSVFDHCNNKLSKVTDLNLRNNHLTKFPDVFHIFPAITNLYLESNFMEIIEFEKVRNDNVLSHIYLNHNEFKRVPNALNKMTNLEYLHLQNNDITSIEDNDLSGLVNLYYLDLGYNPIKYISPHAFVKNNALAFLSLTGTNLKTIPAAVRTLPHLSNLDMQTTDRILCTCEMSYLKGWNATAVEYFYGFCAYTGIRLQNYIMTSLQKCP